MVATLVLSGTAIAVTDTNFTYSSVKTGYLTIHPMALAPDGDVSSNNYFINHSTGSLFASAGGCYNTAVNLPQNARITPCRRTTYLGSSGGVAFSRLDRNDLAADISDSIAFQVITDTENVRKSATDTVPNHQRTVWNNVYAYGFGVCLGAGDGFEGPRITYTYTSAGD